MGRDSIYIMVPKKLIYTWIVVTVVQFLLVAGAYQYTNYMSGILCGIVNVSNTTYKSTPPTTSTGKILAKEFATIGDKYHCK